MMTSSERCISIPPLSSLSLATAALVLGSAADRIRKKDVGPDAQATLSHARDYVRFAWYGELGLADRNATKPKTRDRLSRYFSAEWIMARAAFPRGEDDPRRYKCPPEEIYPHLRLFRSGGVLSLLHVLNRLLSGVSDISNAERIKAAAALDILADVCDHGTSMLAYHAVDDD